MKTPQKSKPTNVKSERKDYTIKLSLQGKYDDQPVFQDKMDRANFILKKFGIPKGIRSRSGLPANSLTCNGATKSNNSPFHNH